MPYLTRLSKRCSIPVAKTIKTLDSCRSMVSFNVSFSCFPPFLSLIRKRLQRLPYLAPP